MASATAEELQSKVTNWFIGTGTSAPANSQLYAPLTHDDYQDNRQLCGVGLNLILVHDPPLHIKSEHYTYINLVQSVERNSPARHAGIQSGDIMVEVDGVNLVDGQRMYLPEDLAEMIRGVEGSVVRIAVVRMGVRVEYRLARAPLEGDKMQGVRNMIPVVSMADNDMMSDPYGSPASSPAKKIRPVTP